MSTRTGPYRIDAVFHSEAPGHQEAIAQRRPVAGTRALVILFAATVNAGRGQSRVYDALVLRDDKIPYHFAGVMGDQTPADADEEGAEWPSR